MIKHIVRTLALVAVATPVMLLSTAAAACGTKTSFCCCPEMAGYSYTYPGSYYYSSYMVPNKKLAWKVVSKLRDDPATAHQPIAVSASGGVVQLTGSVGFKYQKAKAVDMARHTYGVSKVYDAIYVRND